MLTSFADDEALFDSIMAGAAGYVLKQVRGSDLVDSVRRVAAGQSLLDPSVTAKVLDRLRKGPDDDPRSPSSPTRSAGSSTCSPRASPTARSASGSTWPRRRSRTTCPTCS